jgi:hypothetical protein
VELPSEFARKVHNGLLLRDDAAVLVRQFREDLASERFETCFILEEDFAQAESLIERHAFDLGLRSLDAIQIAAAVGLRSKGLIEYLVASDRILCRVRGPRRLFRRKSRGRVTVGGYQGARHYGVLHPMQALSTPPR